MSDLFTPFIAAQGTVVLDGALGTELKRRGCDLADPLWSAKVLLEQPDLIRQVHLDYFTAGADAAITASYQASIAGFAARGLDAAAAAALIARSVTLALEARDAFWADARNRVGRQRPFVAASVGPYGAVLADGSEYRGDYALTEDELMAWHRPRMAILVAAGAEILACETIPCMVEARALARLLPEFPQLSAWISFSARDEGHTCQGEPIAACAAELAQNPQVAAIGVNCTVPQYIAGLVRAIRSATDTPIVVYPNLGEQHHPRRGWTGAVSGEAFAADARDWRAAGAQIIGGCCRTTPADIAAIAAWVRGA